MDERNDPEDDFYRDKYDHDRFQKSVAAAARLVDEERVHALEARELGVDLVLPVSDAETGRRRAIDTRVVRVADDLERIARTIDELENVDDQVSEIRGLRG